MARQEGEARTLSEGETPSVVTNQMSSVVQKEGGFSQEQEDDHLKHCWGQV